MMTPQEEDEVVFVRALGRFVYGGQMTQADADEQLTGRYVSFDAAGKAALRKALVAQQQYAQELANNLARFDSIDAEGILSHH